jgi:hypothetical protein
MEPSVVLTSQVDEHSAGTHRAPAIGGREAGDALPGLGQQIVDRATCLHDAKVQISPRVSRNW